MSGVSSDDLLVIIGGLAGTAVGIFILFLLILYLLIPLMVYFIHRSSKRTAIAVEKIAKQNEQLIDLMTNSSDFSFGEFKGEISKK